MIIIEAFKQFDFRRYNQRKQSYYDNKIKRLFRQKTFQATVKNENDVENKIEYHEKYETSINFAEYDEIENEFYYDE